MSPSPMTKWLTGIFRRDLQCFGRTLDAYPKESNIWQTAPGIINSTGTLTLHCVGNLRYYVGTQLGDTGYQRDREAEFKTRGLPRATLHQHITDTIAVIDEILPALPEKRLSTIYPEQLRGVQIQTGDFLLHLAAHLAFHLGQAEYHRRLVTGSTETIGAMAISGLSSAVTETK